MALKILIFVTDHGGKSVKKMNVFVSYMLLSANLAWIYTYMLSKRLVNQWVTIVVSSGYTSKVKPVIYCLLQKTS